MSDRRRTSRGDAEGGAGRARESRARNAGRPTRNSSSRSSRGSSRPSARTSSRTSSRRREEDRRRGDARRSVASERDQQGRRPRRPEPSRENRGPSSKTSVSSVVSGLAGAVGNAVSHVVDATNRINPPAPVARVLERADSSRAYAVVIVFAILALVLFGRLFYLQVIVSDHYSAMAEEARTVSFTTTPHRGTIYDRNGTVLAKSVDATTVYANPSEVTDVSGEAAQIASVLGGEASDYADALSKDSTTFVYVKRQADVDAASELKQLGLDGIYFIADTRREYPCGQIGGQIIGYCNVDGEGITGLELQYNDILSGTPGTYSAERGENGLPIPGGVKEDTPAVDGQDIMISLDIELQEYVENRVAEAASDMSAGGGSSVVMDGATGEIYAMASLPYMDPSDMSNSKSSSDQAKPITQAFEPGSIFKTASALTILEEGAMTPDDTLYCPASITADGYTVSDAHERTDQTFTFRQILDQSSNVGISLSVQKMTDGFSKLYEHIQRYNFCEKTGVDYPGEAAGTLQPLENWATITGWNVSFGQGIAVTPLQLVRFYGAIVNDGVETTPHFLISKPQTGEVPTYDTEDVIENKAAIPTITDMLKTVVTDGTGKNAQIDGYEVAGKTSTAQIADSGVYKQGVYNLCFEGFLPDSSSQLVCFVGLNEVPSQGNVANVFKDIMSFAIDRFKIQPE